MDKNKIKRIFTIILSINLMMVSTSVFANEVNFEIAETNAIITRNIAVIKINNDFVMNNDGSVVCYGETNVQNGYTAKVIIELQQYNDGWDTIKTWSKESLNRAVIDKKYYILEGYSYRLKVIHKAYDKDGEIENIIKYSEIIDYY